MMSARASTLSEVSLEGLNTMQLPAASAGASFHAAMRNGKFHGTICPTTPSGSRRTIESVFSSICEAVPSSARMTPAK